MVHMVKQEEKVLIAALQTELTVMQVEATST